MMTDTQDLQAQHDDLRSRHYAMMNTNYKQIEECMALLREFVTPPLSFAAKKATIEKTRLLLEGWEGV
jgi:hypothetical protein